MNGIFSANFRENRLIISISLPLRQTFITNKIKKAAEVTHRFFISLNLIICKPKKKIYGKRRVIS